MSARRIPTEAQVNALLAQMPLLTDWLDAADKQGIKIPDAIQRVALQDHCWCTRDHGWKGCDSARPSVEQCLALLDREICRTCGAEFDCDCAAEAERTEVYAQDARDRDAKDLADDMKTEAALDRARGIT
jgi:hypothetical protein